jgi:hypothetical protein
MNIFPAVGHKRTQTNKEVIEMAGQRVKITCVAATFGVGFLVWLVFGSVPRTSAIPAFARKYQTACATCHNNPPELNDFGWAFKKNGFKFPKDDADFVKQPQLMLGAPAYKKVFPKAIYPGEIPGTIPIGFRFSGFVNYHSKQPLALGFQPRVDLFAPATFTIISAGSFGERLSWWIDNDISAGGQNAGAGVGDAYLKMNDLSHYLHLPKDSLNVRFGQFELDLPFPAARTINLTDYNIYDEAAVAGALGTTNNPLTLGAPQRGIEIGGYPHDGLFNWSLAVTNGSNNAPPVSNNKNLYANVFKQFNLERDPAVRNEVQAAGPSGPNDHTSVRLGAFYDYGRNAVNVDRTSPTFIPGFGAIEEPYYRAGGYFRFKYQSKLELYGMGMFSHDANLIPNMTTMGLDHGPSINFSGGFVEAEYWAYPWLIPLMRYDIVNSPFDFVNGVSRSFTRNRFSPGIQLLVRPNIKLDFEYNHTFERTVPGQAGFFRANAAEGGIDISF